MVNLSPLMVVALSTAGVALIGAFFGGIVTVINALAQVRRDQIVQAATLLDVARDTEAIKGHVNSEKTASDGVLQTLRVENGLLREMLAHEKTAAALLAQAASHAIATSKGAIDP